MTPTLRENLWLVVGFGGQATFTARFLVQWLASEREKKSVMPVAFWWLSILGGLITLAYALHRRDPVFIVGQSMGLFVYVRNLMLVAKGKARDAKHAARSALAAQAGPGPHAAAPHAEAGKSGLAH